MGIIYELVNMKKESIDNQLPISELFSPGFMKRYTKFASWAEMQKCAEADRTKKILTTRPL
jgi:hypothetical protein